ncbi:MAG TPA: hypothetical protein PLE23_06040 [Saprospiraceae bacterium]|nr:hypothetical protein [Saprospiraceae bacterium]
MYQVFNMGHRMELYVSSKETAESIIAISKKYAIDAQIVGRVEDAERPEVVIRSPFGEFSYLS